MGSISCNSYHLWICMDNLVRLYIDAAKGHDSMSALINHFWHWNVLDGMDDCIWKRLILLLTALSHLYRFLWDNLSIWTGWDLNPRPPTFPLPHWYGMQGRYSTGLNYRPTKLCPNDDNLSVLNMVLFL